MTADNLNNMRVIPDLLAINEKVRPNKVAYRQFDDKSKTWISVTWKEFADMVRSWRKAFTASGLSKGDHASPDEFSVLLRRTVFQLLFQVSDRSIPESSF